MRRTPTRRALLTLACTLLAPAGATAQTTARLAVPEESLRPLPGAQAIATVFQGAELRLGELRGEWREATLDAWIWAPSVDSTRRDGHDLVVAARGGENLRSQPNGRRIARALTGMLLSRTAQRGQWIRVRRTAWIPEAALEPAPAATAATPDGNAQPAATRPAPAPAAPAPGSSATAAIAPGQTRTGHAGANLLATPDGDTLAALRPSAAIEVLGNEGLWTRIRVEGWIRTPALATPGDTAAVLSGVSAAQLAGDPQGFRGRIIEWAVQFIALQHAEKIRTDFQEGEPFILARGPGSDPGFVYIAVPPDHLAEVQRLTPLQRITVLARVRTARSPLMGAPVLELLRIR